MRYFFSGNICFLFYSIPFHSLLFYSVLVYFLLFYFILFLHPLKLKATRMPHFQYQYVFRFTFDLRFQVRVYFDSEMHIVSTSMKDHAFFHRKSNCYAFDAGCWFYAPNHAKWLSLINWLFQWIEPQKVLRFCLQNASLKTKLIFLMQPKMKYQKKLT